MGLERLLPSCLRRSYSKMSHQEVSLIDIGNKWKSKVLQGVPHSSMPAKDKKMYVLSQFPYPSGSLHIGHLRVYTITDALNRFYRLNGYYVVHPMGWDAFGLPAENAAIERQIDPAVWTAQNIAKMKEQLGTMLANFDWDREVTTCSPDYYKFTQEIFLELFKHGMAYQKNAEINWDPVDQTVLANEQVDAQGRSWRSGAVVEKRNLTQWFLGITKFAHDLEKDLDLLKDWPQNVKTMQKNWIGESHGTEIGFKLSVKGSEQLKVFTTRVETLFSVQYIALALDHPLISEFLKADPELKAFIEESKTLLNDSKRGFLLKGLSAQNPFVSEFDLPIFVAPYVLSGYGHGAVMGCPAHDERDYAFWKQNMPQISPKATIFPDKNEKSEYLVLPYTDKRGFLGLGAAEFAGMEVEAAATRISKKLEEIGRGRPVVTYKLRDWLISRQRYWGAPIPIIHCDSCGPVAVPKEDLPVLLPKVDRLATKGNPLKDMSTFVHTTCPSCGNAAKRETDTMDTFMDSSWYFFRYTDPKNSSEPFSSEVANKNLPVDLYIGGIEHAILHLLYSRFISKFLASIGKWDHTQGKGEPFKRLVTQGMVHGKTYIDPLTGRFLKSDEIEKAEGSDVFIKATGQKPLVTYEKMSKSKYNGADPDECIKLHGADATRAHILFQAPIADVLSWDESKIVGIERWLARVLNLTQTVTTMPYGFTEDNSAYPHLNKHDLKFHNEVQQLLEGITSSFKDTLSLNTVISDYMKLTKVIELGLKSNNVNLDLIMQSLKTLITTIYPVVPSVAEEASEKIRSNLKWKWTPYEWPTLQGVRESSLVKYQIVINGKMRFTHLAEKTFIEDRESAIKTLLDLPEGRKYLAGREVKNTIMKGKVVSFVVK
ncbi:LADA_0E12200g1_1 [Lachancea dasiensis]|uniref:leucine--tRNA ligase n=1 Tax=Lachancea dasiensis TaxID=1072105 RepID=A0A1G4JEV3_9SACH|nr:LADA_0E12200g1_1 [Lachancea dasiensis]